MYPTAPTMKEIPLKINIDKYSTVGASVGAGEEQVGAVGALERWSTKYPLAG